MLGTTLEHLNALPVPLLRQVYGPSSWRSKNHSVFELFGGLRVKNPSVFDDFIKCFLGGAQRAPKIDFGGLWVPFESPLGSPFGHVGGSVEPLGHHLGPKWSQKRQHEGLKSYLG